MISMKATKKPSRKKRADRTANVAVTFHPHETQIAKMILTIVSIVMSNVILEVNQRNRRFSLFIGNR